MSVSGWFLIFAVNDDDFPPNVALHVAVLDFVEVPLYVAFNWLVPTFAKVITSVSPLVLLMVNAVAFFVGE